MTTEVQDLTKMEPRDIDKVLSVQWEQEFRLRHRIQREEDNLKRFKALNITKPKDWYPRAITNCEQEIGRMAETLMESRERSKPYEDEFSTRPWKRYFLVRNATGHIHRETYCSTCFPTTEYNWLVDLANCDEGDMVEQYGEKACTICFPNAPVHPAFVQAQSQREEAERVKADATCRGGSGNYYSMQGLVYRPCLECGERARVTPSGALRAHKRPTVEAN